MTKQTKVRILNQIVAEYLAVWKTKTDGESAQETNDVFTEKLESKCRELFPSLNDEDSRELASDVFQTAEQGTGTVTVDSLVTSIEG